MKIHVWLIGIAAIACNHLCHAHPQCLDFRAPFKADPQLAFCTNYQDFGCCSYERDQQIRQKHSQIIQTVGQQGKCSSDNIKEVLCLECSPYAAHIYDSEARQGRQKPLPGLCQAKCQVFYNDCSDVVPYITQDSVIIQSLSTAASFCQQLQLTDPDYCYPDLESSSILNTQIVSNQVTQDGCLCLQPFTDNLANPLLMRVPPDDTGRMFIGEQKGVIHIYLNNGTKLSPPFMDITSAVLSSWRVGDERGLLGLAFHPDFRNNQRLFVYYSIQDSNYQQKIRISEFSVSQTDRNIVNYQSEKVILDVDQPYSNHNGGEILFGIDGYLYLFLGDGGAGGDPQGFAQNTNSLLGKVLRIDINNIPSGSSYGIPVDNPFKDTNGYKPEIYAYGIRNIWRCDVDEGDPITGYGQGRIICGDVGQNAYEEIDIIEKGGNYGWNSREGNRCYNNKCGNIGAEVFPIHDYPHSEGKSVTGGHIYRGCHNPSLNGKYIFGDFVTGRIWALTEDPSTQKWSNKRITMCGSDLCFNGLVSSYESSILSFGEDEDGEIYLLTTRRASSTSPEGKVYKIVDPRVSGDPSKCRSYVPPPPPPTTTTTTTTTTAAPPPAAGGTGAIQLDYFCSLLLDRMHTSGQPINVFYWNHMCKPPSHQHVQYSFNTGSFVPRQSNNVNSATYVYQSPSGLIRSMRK